MEAPVDSWAGRGGGWPGAGLGGEEVGAGMGAGMGVGVREREWGLKEEIDVIIPRNLGGTTTVSVSVAKLMGRGALLCACRHVLESDYDHPCKKTSQHMWTTVRNLSGAAKR